MWMTGRLFHLSGRQSMTIEPSSLWLLARFRQRDSKVLGNAGSRTDLLNRTKPHKRINSKTCAYGRTVFKGTDVSWRMHGVDSMPSQRSWTTWPSPSLLSIPLKAPSRSPPAVPMPRQCFSSLETLLDSDSTMRSCRIMPSADTKQPASTFMSFT